MQYDHLLASILVDQKGVSKEIYMHCKKIIVEITQ